MQFLKILFWCLLAFVAAIFTIGNWTNVPIHLWGGLIADVNLPLLLLITFLAGLLPTTLYFTTVRWRLRNRLSTTERAVNDLRGALSTSSPALVPDADPDAPIAVPTPAPGALL
jgi:putative membrane protein